MQVSYMEGDCWAVSLPAFDDQPMESLCVLVGLFTCLSSRCGLQLIAKGIDDNSLKTLDGPR